MLTSKQEHSSITQLFFALQVGLQPQDDDEDNGDENDADYAERVQQQREQQLRDEEERRARMQQGMEGKLVLRIW